MAVLKCKMCGGELVLTLGTFVAECEFCGTRQTVPGADNEKKLAMFVRADRLRRSNEFDKAAGIYESIITDYPEEAEGYWGLLLCQYGIEYVDDPATGEKIPTCHRTSFASVMDDDNYDQALENADTAAGKLYREEGKRIETLRKNIIQVSNKEDPYDIFICYKETAAEGGRTKDSVIAQNIYDALSEKGYRVFFSRITLEDKLGQEYEPYIFAALNSAKIMLVVGTDYDHFHAVWVRNEWSRFLQLMRKDKNKHLIPCYQDVDSYDVPKEFAKMASQDMSKMGAVQDLLRGIAKILPKTSRASAVTAAAPVAQLHRTSADTLIQRGNLELEDRQWETAEKMFRKAIDMDDSKVEAWLGVVLCEAQAVDLNELENYVAIKHTLPRNFDMVQRYADDDLMSRLRNIQKRSEENERKQYQEEQRHLEQLRREIEEKQRKENTARNLYEMCRKENRIARRMISAGLYHTAVLRSDGKVIVLGNRKKGKEMAEYWTDVIAIYSGAEHIVGLKKNGTVVAAGNNSKNACQVSSWRNIKEIACGAEHTLGLKEDGTVVIADKDEGFWKIGYNKVQEWKALVNIGAGPYHSIGVRVNGTVLCAGSEDVAKEILKQTDLVEVDSGRWHMAALKKDGTVCAFGSDRKGQCDVSAWRNIIQVVVGNSFTAGVTTDGKVVITGDCAKWKARVQEWEDVIAVAAGQNHLVAVKRNGYMVGAGQNYEGETAVATTRLFVDFNEVMKKTSDKA